jgi:hypothetical protein
MEPKIPADAARQAAEAAGGTLGALVSRQPRGVDQVCPWEFVALAAPSKEHTAAAAWIVADAIMKGRTGTDTKAYNLWRTATLSGAPLEGTERAHVLAFATPVFAAAGNEGKKSHGLAGYVGEWLWYLLAKEAPLEPGQKVEILPTPGPTVTDSGGDGIIIHRLEGAATTFVFRLWEMKKFTADKSTDVSPTVRGAWQQLNEKGASYLAAMSWADKHLAEDTRAFVSTLVPQWVNAAPSSNGGVSVAVNPAAAPDKAFHTAHNHFSTHTHPGALQGLIVAIDDFESFAADVREYVWTAL